MEESRFKEIMLTYDQEEILEKVSKMNERDKARILRQCDFLDFTFLKALKEKEKARGFIEPIKTMKLAEIEKNRDEYEKIGVEAIKAGKVGALVLAGGMGTRLGSHHAKGMYDIGITKPVYIFQRMFENMMDVVNQTGAWIPLFIMTNIMNDREIKEFLVEHKCFGYNPAYIKFFAQDMSPCVDYNGKILFAKPDEFAMSPNGNGGFYSSMMNAGLDKLCKEKGIEYINVFAIDNVLQRIADPVFVGATIKSGCATGAKVVKKADPGEKVGSICLEDGQPSVVEYYEMTDELMQAKDEEGEPAYDYGVILNYLFRVKEMDSIVRNEMPVHIVKKKVPYLAESKDSPTGYITVDPQEPNAYKLETLSLDFVQMMGSCLPFEVVREREFAPIKNSMGIDSVDSARKMLLAIGYEL
ncbi:MAG: UTP--glucose-1-phosphate uridylyltransferase [Lachnospiraceae bacterium]|nr:UTP--glucose-1-phosphate uridylyltransferase [Lachnospiraceae bacterium]